MNTPRFRPGQVPKADDFNRLIDLANALYDIVPAGDIEASIDDGGIMLSGAPREGFWIRVTSHITANQYAWTLLYHDSGTTFDDGPDDDDGGDDPAYEYHGNTTLDTPFVAWAVRDRTSGQVLFAGDACPDGG